MLCRSFSISVLKPQCLFLDVSCKAAEGASRTEASQDAEGEEMDPLLQISDDDGKGVWTPEQEAILDALFATRPKPVSSNKPVLLPPKTFSKFRPPGTPRLHSRLHRPPALARSPPSNPALVPYKAKDKRFLAHLAEQLCRTTPGGPASDVLDQYAHQLLRGSLSAAIRDLGRMGRSDIVFDVFLWQQDFPHLWPDNRTLNAAIEVLAESGLEEKAFSLQQTWGPKSPLAFASLIHGFALSNRLDAALCAKEKAESTGCSLDQGVHADLILLASRVGRKDVVCKLVQELAKFAELNLSLEHCTSVMAACRKVKLYDAVERLFEWWKSSGFQANVIMYEIVMTSLERGGKHRKALAVYWEMESNSCDPDLLLYTTLFRLCVEVGDCSKALRLYARMRDAQIPPTYQIYTNLIKLCCKDGRIGKANEVLEAMRREGMATKTLEELSAG